MIIEISPIRRSLLEQQAKEDGGADFFGDNSLNEQMNCFPHNSSAILESELLRLDGKY